ncbi:hypothetical protein EXN00_05970 [Clostridium botulinum]|nr:hypothetical protein [Clostridium botulinum]NFC12475.1 hypothetical protein [Clostridium botulinum]NFC16887.1 hypothetical protein [Clostridium botulinum]NFC21528.1 hypothetical protein [Clostridium botulinum]NFC25260.1 hypothetical protein [Clostridium botulinum]
MNIPGLILIVIGIIFLIHSVIYKNKIGINRSNKFIIVNKQKLLNLQLYCSILNSACMVIWGVVVIRYNLPNIYVAAYGLIFTFINYIVIPIARGKNYIKYK